jgi:capsular exopolysaccharide synthesis family protein
MGRFEDILKKADKDRKEILKNQGDDSSALSSGYAETDQPYQILKKFPKSIYIEQYQTLKINIERKLRDVKNRILLVTSSSRGEGKTTTAMNLSYSIASDSDINRVILIDGDLRKPQIGENLNIKKEVGLTDYLMGKSNLDESIFKNSSGKLDFILGGSLIDNPSEILHTNNLIPLFDSLRQRYDWIIVDSPPVLLFSDSLTYSEVVDGVVMVVKGSNTSKPVIQRGIETFPENKIIGYVLNQVVFPIPDSVYKLVFGKTHGYDYYYSKKR